MLVGIPYMDHLGNDILTHFRFVELKELMHTIKSPVHFTLHEAFAIP